MNNDEAKSLAEKANSSLSALVAREREVHKKIEQLPDDKKSIVLDTKRQVETEIDRLNNDLFDWEHEGRIRANGLLPSQAEELAFLIKKKRVGEIFHFYKEDRVLTPFGTVVNAQVYIDTLQNRLLELTSVPVEIEVSVLKKTIDQFTSLSFFGLITLAFKRLFKKG